MKYDKLQKTKAETAGFTLVEIVAVLVLLGILAAVAVPKIFDLQEQSEKKAAEAALNEAQVRINTKFSTAMKQGMECDEAVEKVNRVQLIADQTDDENNKFNNHLIFGGVISANGTSVAVSRLDGKYKFDNLGKLFVPQCIDWENKEDTDEDGDCSLAGINFTCFNESSVCHYDNGDPATSGKWQTGSTVTTVDGLYVVMWDKWCGNGTEMIEQCVNNPSSCSDVLIKPIINRERRWEENTYVCSNNNCSWKNAWNELDGDRVLKKGDWYFDGDNVFVWVDDGNYEWTITKQPPKYEQGIETNMHGWVRLHSGTIVPP